MPLTSFRCLILAAIPALMLLAGAVRAQADPVVVFAAASLTTALNSIADIWATQSGHSTTLSFAGSAALARQIQQGAPADIFISASPDWMDVLAASGDLRDDTRRDLLGNTLVLIAHGAQATPVTLDETLDLTGLLGSERLSMALVDAVPAGIYGKEALQSLDQWTAVEPLVAQSDNVRTALAFVARNEAPFGIVYVTDATVEDAVTIIGSFPQDSHAPIIYSAAITAQSISPRAADFLAFLSSDPAQGIWAAQGFILRD